MIISVAYFNSRPCGRGFSKISSYFSREKISIHAPAGGASPSCSTAMMLEPYFNSRPCGRGFSTSNRIFFISSSISIHAPAGGASEWTDPDCWAKAFQFTPLREGLLKTPDIFICPVCISIHAPAGGASNFCNLWARENTDFNSRPCGRGFFRRRAWEIRFVISIHAPAGGASKKRGR